MSWLIEHYGDLLIIVMVMGILYLCISSLIRQKKSGVPSCACGKNCATCALRYMHGKAVKQ